MEAKEYQCAFYSLPGVQIPVLGQAKKEMQGQCEKLARMHSRDVRLSVRVRKCCEKKVVGQNDVLSLRFWRWIGEGDVLSIN